MYEDLQRLFENINHLYHPNFQVEKDLKDAFENYSTLQKNGKNSETNLIMKSYKNMLLFDSRKATEPERNLFLQSAKNTFQSISTFARFMNREENNLCKEIETKLFRIVFSPEENNPNTHIFSVYKMHDQFIYGTDRFANFKSSTGSGKTRCAPFFFSIMALRENLRRQFFIMTQPGLSIIHDKIEDFSVILGDSVILTSNVNDLLKLYQKPPQKPVVALLTPHAVLSLLTKGKNLSIYQRTRFCLDEIHERKVETDVLIAKLGKEMLSIPYFSMQVLMMSATPDPRVLKVFGNVKELSLEDTFLFKINDNFVQTELKDIISEIIKETGKIVLKMANSEFDPGHILIFVSGNSRMNQIKKIINEIEISCEREKSKRKVILLKDMDSFITNKESFYEQLQERIGEERENLYLLPIKYASFVSQDQQEIAKSPIKNFGNVIKIIIATNAIESSITIDGLAAVVDSGLFNHATFDESKGITTIQEEPISKQSQIQRRGRVGRIRDGISVQITIAGKPLQESLPPSILVEDISSNILSLRTIGYNLEEIENLPDKIPQEKLDGFIKKLFDLKAIDPQTKNITDLGRNLGQFLNLSPIFSASIIECSNQYPNSNLYLILGSLIAFIFNDSNLVQDYFSKQLQKNFCEDSDVMTVLKTIIDIPINKGKMWREGATEYGLGQKNVLQILYSVKQIGQNLGIIDGDNDDDNIFKQIQDLINKTDMNTFIQRLIETIGKNQKEWIGCRKANFKGIENCMFSPYIIYESEVSIQQNGNLTKIQVNQRPGSYGFSCPAHAFILKIEYVKDNDIYNGFYIQKNISKNQNDPHPIAIKSTPDINNEFADRLIETLLLPYKEKFEFLGRMRSSNANTKNLLFLRNSSNIESTFTFIPKEQNIEVFKQLFNNAIKTTQTLMPYTPSTIISYHSLLKCVIAISQTHCQLNYQVIKISDKTYTPYSLSSNVIQFLINNLQKLDDPDNTLRICLTDDYIGYELVDPEEKKNENEIKNSIKIDSKDNKVFGVGSHLVLLSKDKIPNETPLEWIRTSTQVDDSNDILASAANKLFQTCVSVRRASTQIFFTQPNDHIKIDGKIPALPSGTVLPDHGNQQRPIGKLFDRFAMACIKGQKLKKEVKLKSFEPSETKLSQHVVFLASRMVSNDQPIPDDIQELVSFDQEQINKKKQQLNEELQLIQDSKLYIHAPNECRRIQRKNNLLLVLLENLPSNLSLFQNAFNFFTKIKQANQNLDDYKSFQWGNSFYLSVKPTNNPNQIANNFKSAIGVSLIHELIPAYSITVKHLRKNSLSQEEFVSLVQSVTSHFGCLIQKIFDYKPYDNSPFIKGSITLIILTSEFTIPLVGMIKEAIEKTEGFGVIIPGSVIDFSIQRQQIFKTDFNNWIKEQNPNVEFDDMKLRGSELDCDNILKNIGSYNIPFKSISIPSDLPLDIVSKKIRLFNRRNGTSWIFKRISQEIIVPTVETNLIPNFFELCRPKGSEKAEQDLFGDVLMCGDEAISSKIPINVYYKNSPPISKSFCVPCTFETIKHLVSTMYDEALGTPIYERILENQDLLQVIVLSDDEVIQKSNDDWPRVPLGQKIWALINDNTTAEVTKIWLTAAKVYGFRHSNLITFCPQHPNVLLLAPPLHTPMKCIFKECDCSICPECSLWHKPGMCNVKPKLPPGYRICPSCFRMVEKTEACNHIACSCGKHFCYYCGAGPWVDKGDCYDHLSKEHGGCFNNPPDYRKYYLHESVSDIELNAFYEKYSKYKP